MMVLKDKAGFVQWIYEVDGHLKEIFFRPDEILHLRVPCSGGFHYALPQWIGGQGMIELTAAATAYNAAFFRNRAIPDYAIITKQGMLSEAAKAKVQDFFRGEFAGAENAHRALYIPAGAGSEVEFKKLTEDRKEADFLKLLDAARERIITAHGVPPRMLGIMTAGQLGGGGEVAEQLKVFEVTSLRPKRRRMAEQWEITTGEMGLETLEFAPLDLEPEKPEAPAPPPAEPIAPAVPEKPKEPEAEGDGEDVMKTADLVAMLWKDA
jgi:HK97 family phage portal protein